MCREVSSCPFVCVIGVSDCFGLGVCCPCTTGQALAGDCDDALGSVIRPRFVILLIAPGAPGVTDRLACLRLQTPSDSAAEGGPRARVGP